MTYSTYNSGQQANNFGKDWMNGVLGAGWGGTPTQNYNMMPQPAPVNPYGVSNGIGAIGANELTPFKFEMPQVGMSGMPNTPELSFWDKLWGGGNSSNTGTGASFWGSKDTGPGWGGQAVGMASGIANIGMGYMGLKDSRKRFDFQKEEANRNYANQTQDMNRRLEAQQKGLVANSARSNEADKAMSVEEYMKKNKVG